MKRKAPVISTTVVLLSLSMLARNDLYLYRFHDDESSYYVQFLFDKSYSAEEFTNGVRGGGYVFLPEEEIFVNASYEADGAFTAETVTEDPEAVQSFIDKYCVTVPDGIIYEDGMTVHTVYCFDSETRYLRS